MTTETKRKASALQVYWEPNLRIGIRAFEGTFKVTLDYLGDSLLYESAKSRADAERVIAKQLETLGLDKDSLENINEWIDLDGRKKMVEGKESPSTTLNVYIG